MIMNDVTMEMRAAEMGLELAYIANDAHTAMIAAKVAATGLWNARKSDYTNDLLTEAYNKADYSVSLAGIAYHSYKNAAEELIGRHRIGEKVIQESMGPASQNADSLVSVNA